MGGTGSLLTATTAPHPAADEIISERLIVKWANCGRSQPPRQELFSLAMVGLIEFDLMKAGADDYEEACRRMHLRRSSI